MSLLEPYQQSNRPGRDQPPREPEDIDADLEWEAKRIVKSEIINYVRRRRRIQEIKYFVNWAVCSEDNNTGVPRGGLKHGQEMVEEFHRENPEMRKLG